MIEFRTFWRKNHN